MNQGKETTVTRTYSAIGIRQKIEGNSAWYLDDGLVNSEIVWGFYNIRSRSRVLKVNGEVYEATTSGKFEEWASCWRGWLVDIHSQQSIVDVVLQTRNAGRNTGCVVVVPKTLRRLCVSRYLFVVRCRVVLCATACGKVCLLGVTGEQKEKLRWWNI